MHRIFFRRRLACNPRHLQNRTGSSPEPASRAGSLHPVHPVHPVHRCSLLMDNQILFRNPPQPPADPFRTSSNPLVALRRPSWPFVDNSFPTQKRGLENPDPFQKRHRRTNRRIQAVAFSFLPPSALTSIFFGRAAGARGTVISRTPLLKEASILSRSVPFGKSSVCSYVP